MTKLLIHVPFLDRPTRLFHPTLSLIRAAALTPLLTVSVACAATPLDQLPVTSSADGGYQQPENMRYTVSWTQEEAVDLASSDATFVRAFLESASLIHNVKSVTETYPGFDAAMLPAIDPERVNILGGAHETYGEEHNRIVEFSELSENTVRVIVCIQRPLGSPRTPISTPRRPNQGSVSATLLVYERKGVAPPENQRGPRAVPYGSVFGGWNAIEYDPLYSPKDRSAVAPCLTPNFNPELGRPSTPGWPAGPQPSV